MITISRYFPTFVEVSDDSAYCRTKCKTAEEAVASECWKGRVGDGKLQYPEYEDPSKETSMVFFQNGFGSIVVVTDTTEEMKTLVDTAGVVSGKWW